MVHPLDIAAARLTQRRWIEQEERRIAKGENVQRQRYPNFTPMLEEETRQAIRHQIKAEQPFQQQFPSRSIPLQQKSHQVLVTRQESGVIRRRKPKNTRKKAFGFKTKEKKEKKELPISYKMMTIGAIGLFLLLGAIGAI
jgi:hypothetical protein